MCKTEPGRLEAFVRQAAAGSGAAVFTVDAPAPTPAAAAGAGSRRRRLWDLDGHAHCPVVGVCLPMAALRRVVDKALGGSTVADGYELHCGAVAESKHRSPMTEAIQRELDRRYMLAVRQAARAKTPEALAAWWQEASQSKDLAGALWATLTHARCTPALEDRVLGEVHMVQHQVGMARRVDLARFESLIDENAVLARELGAAQQRAQRQAAEQARRVGQQQAEIVTLRAALVVRDTAVAAAREELQALEAAVPSLKARDALVRESRALVERVHELQRALLQEQQAAEEARRRAAALADELHERAAASPPEAGAAAAMLDAPLRLEDRAVLCVGGRPASVPIYRRLIEGTGGRFLHHDGGSEDSVSKLDATLATADLVICQTGCISHDAYWRVKDHCKRTGKRCVFVENPSSAGLRRALVGLVPAVA